MAHSNGRNLITDGLIFGAPKVPLCFTVYSAISSTYCFFETMLLWLMVAITVLVWYLDKLVRPDCTQRDLADRDQAIQVIQRDLRAAYLTVQELRAQLKQQTPSDATSTRQREQMSQLRDQLRKKDQTVYHQCELILESRNVIGDLRARLDDERRENRDMRSSIKHCRDTLGDLRSEFNSATKHSAARLLEKKAQVAVLRALLEDGAEESDAVDQVPEVKMELEHKDEHKGKDADKAKGEDEGMEEDAEEEEKEYEMV